MPHQEIKANSTEILLLITVCVMKKIEWCEKVFDMFCVRSLLSVTIIVDPWYCPKRQVFSFKNSTVNYQKADF
jgi:hypothetical protein